MQFLYHLDIADRPCGLVTAANWLTARTKSITGRGGGCVSVWKRTFVFQMGFSEDQYQIFPFLSGFLTSYLNNPKPARLGLNKTRWLSDQMTTCAAKRLSTQSITSLLVNKCDYDRSPRLRVSQTDFISPSSY